MSEAAQLFLVFVYGTLKKDLPNHYLLLDENKGNATFIGEAKTGQTYPLVIGTRYNVPFLLDIPAGHRIDGEIYQIDEKMRSTLDELEDHPNTYARQEIDIIKNDGLDDSQFFLSNNHSNRSIKFLIFFLLDSNSSTISCWTYFLKEYPANFLNGRELLSSYIDPPEQAYVLPSLRPSTLQLKDDLDYPSMSK